jgi:hypothetical protein
VTVAIDRPWLYFALSVLLLSGFSLAAILIFRRQGIMAKS